MSEIKITEWYDGPLQFLKTFENGAFYGICVDANLASATNVRTYFIFEISRSEHEALLNAILGGSELIDEVVKGFSHARHGALYKGDPEAFESAKAAFEVPGERYTEYFAFPIVDLLADRG